MITTNLNNKHMTIITGICASWMFSNSQCHPHIVNYIFLNRFLINIFNYILFYKISKQLY